MKNGIFSGRVQNCYVRLDTVSETAILEIFFPKSAGEDRRETRDILNIPCIVNMEWVDSGLRLFLKGLSPEKLNEAAESLMEKIAAYFTAKYPDDVFRCYREYSCGKKSKIIFLHFNTTIVLEFCEELREDFTKNFFKVVFNEAGNCEKIYINCYEAGTLEYKNGFLEMHRWENEDEAQSGSYLSRHYTQRLLDGVVEGTDMKTTMISIIRSSISKAAIKKEDSVFFVTALDFLGKIKQKKLT